MAVIYYLIYSRKWTIYSRYNTSADQWLVGSGLCYTDLSTAADRRTIEFGIGFIRWLSILIIAGQGSP